MTLFFYHALFSFPFNSFVTFKQMNTKSYLLLSYEERTYQSLALSNYIFFQIIGVDLTDEGKYTCIADNGRGIPAEAEMNLGVDNAKDLPAQIVEPESSDLVMSLGVPAHFKCLAFGYPKPTVTW